jgi:hypothetical protein
VYTDANWRNGKGRIAGFMFREGAARPLGFRTRLLVAEDLHQSFRKHPINMLEAVGPFVAAMAWGAKVAEYDAVLVCIDNTVAQQVLTSGRSRARKSYLNVAAARVAAAFAKLGARPMYRRVPSAENCADVPTKKDLWDKHGVEIAQQCEFQDELWHTELKELLELGGSVAPLVLEGPADCENGHDDGACRMAAAFEAAGKRDAWAAASGM